MNLERARLETQRVHLVVERHVVIDRLLHVSRQFRHRHRTLGLRRRRLERVGGQHALEPRHPLLEDGQVLRRVLPVEHPVLELNSDLVAEQPERGLCRATDRQSDTNVLTTTTTSDFSHDHTPLPFLAIFSCTMRITGSTVKRLHRPNTHTGTEWQSDGRIPPPRPQQTSGNTYMYVVYHPRLPRGVLCGVCVGSYPDTNPNVT